MICAQALAALQGGRVAGETSRQCRTYSLALAAPTSDVHEACADTAESNRADNATTAFMHSFSFDLLRRGEHTMSKRRAQERKPIRCLRLPPCRATLHARS